MIGVIRSPFYEAQLEAFNRFRIAKLRCLDYPTPANAAAVEKTYREFEAVFCADDETNVVPMRRTA